MPDTTDLYTTVRNITDKTLHFSYLGKHGRTLTAGAQTTIWGHIQHSFGHGEIAIRKRRALEKDINVRLQILSTPRPLFYDTNPDAIVADPTTAATHSATGGGSSGGNLPAGTYYVSYTFVNAWGESLVGTSESTQMTVSAGNIPRVTVPALPTNATSINIYLTNTNGATGTGKLYKTGVTTTTTDLTTSTWNGGTYAASTVPPTTNTTKAATVRGIKSTDNVLGTVDPSWGRYTG